MQVQLHTINIDFYLFNGSETDWVVLATPQRVDFWGIK